jgi:hypothetical protein
MKAWHLGVLVVVEVGGVPAALALFLLRWGLRWPGGRLGLNT